jgi:putative aldouronate transport system substrate-binding protein
MRKLLKVGIVLALISLVATTAFAGSQKETKTTGEKLTILWQVGEPNTTEPVPAPDNYVETLLEKRFNVNIDTLQIGRAEAQRLQAMVAEGKMPDKVWGISGMNQFNMIEQGLIRSVDPEWFYQYMPTRMKLLEERYGYSKAEMIERHKYEGKWYGVSAYYSSKTPGYILTYRQDWADKVGYTKKLTTVDDCFELFKRLTFNDPDGNGKDDTWAIGGPSNWGAMTFQFLSAPYGIMSYTYRVRDGKVTFDGLVEPYKQFMTEMRKWYAAGVIDPEFVSDDIEVWLAKWFTEKHGAFYCGGHGFMDAYGDYMNPILERNPNARFTHVDALKGPGGVAGYPESPAGQIAYGTIGSEPTFGYKTTDAQVKKIMEMFDAVLADEELYVQVTLGEENKMWKWQDGARMALPGYGYQQTQGQQAGLMCYFNVAYAPFEWWAKRLTKHDQDMLAWWDAQPKLCRGVCFNTGDYNPYTQTYSDMNADYERLYPEYFFKVVTGRVEIAATWEDYQKQMAAIGVTKYISELQEIYDKVQKGIPAGK